MKRWINAKHKKDESPDVDAFLNDIVAVCNKHGLWLSHEDCHGAFEVVKESTEDWLLNASDARRDA